MGSDSPEDFGVGALVFALAAGVVARVYLSHALRVPYTVIMLLVGVLVGVTMHKAEDHLESFGRTVGEWVGISPEVLLLVFLPPVIFESGFNTDVHIFQREFWQVLTLAGPGVVLASVLTACVLKYWLPYGWDWPLALVFGSLLCATDPVAVVTVLKEMGISERMSVLIDGESLLNDSTAIVIFVIFKDIVAGATGDSAAMVVAHGARLGLGGPVLGYVLGMAGSLLLGYIINDPVCEIAVTLVVCYSTFLLAEATSLHVSGVLAVVTTGLVMSFYARGRISPSAEASMHLFWRLAAYVGNTSIFFAAGLIAGNRAMFSPYVTGSTWGHLVLLYVALHLVRAVLVLACSPVLVMGGYGMDWKQMLVLTFAGPRGAVCLTLAVIVAEDRLFDLPTRDRMLFLATGISAITLILNGFLSSILLRSLGMDRLTTAETEIFVRACSAIELRLEHQLEVLKGDRFLGDADWDIVWRYIPVLTARVYWHRVRHGSISLLESEDRDIRAMAQRFREAQAAQGGAMFRLRQVGRRCSKWFARKFLGSFGGDNYTELPRRLRYTWYQYHKAFHLGAKDATEEMELHRQHAHPQPGAANIEPSSVAGMKLQEYDTGPQLGAVSVRSLYGVETGWEAPQSPAGATSGAFSHQDSQGGLSLASAAGLEDQLATAAGLEDPRETQLERLARDIWRLRVDRERAMRDLRWAEDDVYERERQAEKATEQFEGEAGNSGTPHRPKVSIPRHHSASARLSGVSSPVSVLGYSMHMLSRSVQTGLSRLNLVSMGMDTPKAARDMDDMELATVECRSRFLQAVKANYQERHRNGWLGSTGLRVLKENIETQLDHKAVQLDEWDRLASSFTLAAATMAVCRKTPLLGPLLEPYIYKRLAFIFELASNFISAHEDVDILELIEEGPVAYQLAYEKNRQLNHARDTLAQQLPVFPELARSLKTQVAARYMLGQHRAIVGELWGHGHINDKERDNLLHQNDVARIKLDYHPHTDHIPDRMFLLRSVPFLRFLSDQDRRLVVCSERACQEEFYGSSQILMAPPQNGGDGPRHRAHERAGWFVVVRGSVRQVTGDAPLADHEVRGSLTQRMFSKERILHSGAVFGLDSQLLEDQPCRHTYITASFVHLFFFDTAQMLLLAERFPQLKRGLWWALAVSSVRHQSGFRKMTLRDVHQVMRAAEFVELRHGASGTPQISGAATVGGHRRSATQPATIAEGVATGSVSMLAASSAMSAVAAAPGEAGANVFEGAAERAPAADSRARRASSKGIMRARSLSRGRLKGESGAGDAATHWYSMEAGGQLLLLRGRMLRRRSTDRYPAVEPRESVAFISDVYGPLEFTDGTVMFHLPATLVKRSSSSHQILMSSIQSLSTNNAARAGEPRTGGPREPGEGAPPLPALDVLGPLGPYQMEMDMLRRQRTARDEGLAAKAVLPERPDGPPRPRDRANTAQGHSYRARRKTLHKGRESFVEFVSFTAANQDEDPVDPRARRTFSETNMEDALTPGGPFPGGTLGLGGSIVPAFESVEAGVEEHKGQHYVRRPSHDMQFGEESSFVGSEDDEGVFF